MIVVVHNSDIAPAGRLEAHLPEAKHVALHRGDRLPEEVSGAVLLGGEMGAHDEERHPYLADEKAWVRYLVERSVPVLGICLGAQLIADALGRRAFPTGVPEAGLLDVRVSPAGASDPVFGGLQPPVFTYHADSFEVPPDGVLLAETDRYPQAFRAGSALGLQFHPEVGTSIARGWLFGDLRRLAVSSGVDPEQLYRDLVDGEARLDAQAGRLFRRWIASVAAESSAPPGARI